MILADLGRAVAFATIPLCYALHVLTLAQMCVVTFVAGALSVLFTVSDGTLFVSIVEPEEYVDGQSLIYGSRALSFLGGPSVGGLLVQALSGPYAVVVDALSFLGSAFQLGSIRPVEPPAARRRGRAHRRAAVHRRLADRAGVADRRRGGQLLQPDVRGAVHAVRGAHPAGSAPGCSAWSSGRARSAASSARCCASGSPRGSARGWSTWRGASCSPSRWRWSRSPRPRTGMLMLLMLFASCFASGFGVMVLDISIAAIFGVVIPDTAAVAGLRRAPGDQLRHPARPGRCSAGCSAPRSACGPRCGSRWPAGCSARCCCSRRRCRASACPP